MPVIEHDLWWCLLIKIMGIEVGQAGGGCVSVCVCACAWEAVIKEHLST